MLQHKTNSPSHTLTALAVPKIIIMCDARFCFPARLPDLAQHTGLESEIYKGDS